MLLFVKYLEFNIHDIPRFYNVLLSLLILTGMAPIAYLLFSKFMRFSPSNPEWVNNLNPKKSPFFSIRFFDFWFLILVFLILHLLPYKLIQPNRDRFVLSNGHACALLYSMLHLTGYSQMSMDAIKKFRQLDSVTPGHPEVHITDGVEVTTGPLGLHRRRRRKSPWTFPLYNF